MFSPGQATGAAYDHDGQDCSQQGEQDIGRERSQHRPLTPAGNGSANPGLRYRLESSGPWGPGRAELEHFVAEAFRRRHGAHIHSFMPTLLALRDAGSKVCAVAGYRLASREPLFLEQYLEEPVEQALANRLGERVPRSQVVEIGNFAGDNCRAARQLAALLPHWLLAQGQAWAVFTATSLIREILAGLGIRMVELKGADQSRLAGNGDDWGAYYATDPRVMAASVPEAMGLSLARRRPRH